MTASFGMGVNSDQGQETSRVCEDIEGEVRKNQTMVDMALAEITGYCSI